MEGRGRGRWRGGGGEEEGKREGREVLYVHSQLEWNNAAFSKQTTAIQ